MSTDKKDSIVMQSVRLIWDHANSGKCHSWQILNHSLHYALQNAIRAHLLFESDDFSNLFIKLDGSYWMGTDADGKAHGGHYYSLAVKCGNASACKSYEAWRQMQPFLWLGQRLCEIGLVDTEKLLAAIAQMDDPRDSKLIEGLKGNSDSITRWHCTSLNAAEIRFCSYYRPDNERGDQKGKPASMMAWTHAELSQFNAMCRKAMRERSKVLKAEQEAKANDEL